MFVMPTMLEKMSLKRVTGDESGNKRRQSERVETEEERAAINTADDGGAKGRNMCKV